MKKNKLKGLILMVMLCLIGIAGYNVTALASDSPAIVGGSTKGTAGDIVTVDVSLKNNPGITSITLDFDYDTENMKLVNVENAGLLPGALFVTSETLNENPYRAIWTIGNTDTSANGTLAKLTFRIEDNAKEGNYPVSISYLPDDIYNTELTNVAFEVTDINIEVITQSTPTPKPASPTSDPQDTEDTKTHVPQNPTDNQTSIPESENNNSVDKNNMETQNPEKLAVTNAPTESGKIDTQTGNGESKSSNTANTKSNERKSVNAAKTDDKAMACNVIVLLVTSIVVIIALKKRRVNN